MTEPIRAQHDAALHEINAAFSRLPQSAQDGIEIARDPLEAEVDAAILADDREGAEAAIRAWRGYWLDRFERTAT